MTSRAEAIAQLQAAIEGFQGGQLFDEDEQRRLAPIRERALRLLDQRGRSRAELRERLLAAGAEEFDIDTVLDDLERSGLVDDAAFATEWVRQRHARRGKSVRALEEELRRKGIGESVRARALAQIDEEDEATTARRFARKKARSLRTVPADRAEHDKALRRIVGVLVRRGFGQGMALSIARECLAERIAELDSGDATGYGIGDAAGDELGDEGRC